MSDLVLRRVRLWPREVSGPEVDVVLRGGRIAEIVAEAAVAADSAVVDCAGGLLMPTRKGEPPPYLRYFPQSGK